MPNLEGRCKDCKHWARLKQGYSLMPVRGLCVAISTENWLVSEEFEAPLSETVLDDDSPRIAEATCLSEGIGGELMTAPEFGCVLFEAREEADHA